MLEKRNCCVYWHRNKINNHRYIGYTEQKPEDRWNNGNGYKGQKIFSNAIFQYGWLNFEHKIIFQNLTLSEAIYHEKALIKFYKTNAAKLGKEARGYNSTDGGEGTRGLGDNHWSKTSKNECERVLGKRIYMYDLSGKFVKSFNSARACERFLTGKKNKQGSGSHINKICEREEGVSHGFQFRYYYSKDGIGKAFSQTAKTQVSSYNLKGELIRTYECIQKAAKDVGIDPSTVSRVVNGDLFYSSKTNLIWRYGCEKSIEINLPDYLRPINCYNLDGSFVRSFLNYKDAIEYFRSNGIFRIRGADIGQVCYRKRRSAYGYQFRFADNKEGERSVESIKIKKQKNISPRQIKTTTKYCNIFIYKDNKYVCECSSIPEACAITGLKPGRVRGNYESNILFKTKGFTFSKKKLSENEMNEILNSRYDVNKKRYNQYSIDGKFIRSYLGMREVRDALGISTFSSVSSAAKYPDSRICHGYRWTIGENPVMNLPPLKKTSKTINIINSFISPQATPILQFNKETKKFIKGFPSINAAAKELNIPSSNISDHINHDKRKTCHGYIFERVF